MISIFSIRNEAFLFLAKPRWQQPWAGGNQQEPGNGGNGGENVTDAEYEEVK